MFFESLPPALLIPFSVTRFRTLLSVVGDVSFNRRLSKCFHQTETDSCGILFPPDANQSRAIHFSDDLAVAFTTILSSHPITLP